MKGWKSGSLCVCATRGGPDKVDRLKGGGGGGAAKLAFATQDANGVSQAQMENKHTKKRGWPKKNGDTGEGGRKKKKKKNQKDVGGAKGKGGGGKELYNLHRGKNPTESKKKKKEKSKEIYKTASHHDARAGPKTRGETPGGAGGGEKKLRREAAFGQGKD